jgi:hypothetical protein
MTKTSEASRGAWGDSRSRSSFREHALKLTPRWYSPWAHLAGTAGIGLATLVLALVSLEGVVALELLVVPVTLVAANLFEWHAHRHVLHRRFRPLEVLYRQHTPGHHRVYRYGDMAMRSVREFRLVLIPASGVLALVVLTSPVALLVGWLLGANVGWLFLLTASSYVVLYELTHLCYHLPEHHPLHRLPFVRRLAEHHARHHHPPLMQRWNFNVTVPLGDWLFGTIAPPDLVAKARDEAASTRDRGDDE